MGIATANQQTTGLAAGALLLLGLCLGACGTSTGGSSPMDARAQAAPPTPSAYPAVEDLPPERQEHAMTPDERTKLKKELSAARDRQTTAAKSRQGAPRAEPAKP